jgi:hypothetical protein
MANSSIYLGKIIESLCINNSKQQFVSEIKIAEEYADGKFRIPLKVYGTAFKAGKHKDINYSPKEINNPKQSLNKQKCDVDHDDKIIGHIDLAEHKNGQVTYSAIVSDEKIAKEIYAGKIKYVSPKIISKRCFVDGETYAKEIEFTGLSFLKNKQPGSEGTSVIL